MVGHIRERRACAPCVLRVRFPPFLIWHLCRYGRRSIQGRLHDPLSLHSFRRRISHLRWLLRRLRAAVKVDQGRSSVPTRGKCWDAVIVQCTRLRWLAMVFGTARPPRHGGALALFRVVLELRTQPLQPYSHSLGPGRVGVRRRILLLPRSFHEPASFT